MRELGQVVDLRETLLGFIKHGRVLLDEVAAACRENEEGIRNEKTAKVAHALKGAARTVGASRLASCAEQMEREAKEGQACTAFLPGLEAAFNDLAVGVSQRPWP